MRLSILYRGPLASCNYGCWYCPFAKQKDTAAEQAIDEQALKRFIEWVRHRCQDRLSVFFTPWGEALIHRRYQRALVTLSHMPHVERVAIQTNLSCRLSWIAEANLGSLALWTTYHPDQQKEERFLQQCRELDEQGARYSVGMVGLSAHIDAIEHMRQALPDHVYLWINAYKHQPNHYTEALVERFTRVDPLFSFNNQRHPSQGRACRCGSSVISVDGEGTIRRCHFIRETIGSIYVPGWEERLHAQACTNETCGCHIGYVHMDHLGLYDVFGQGILERIPREAIWRTS